MAKIEHKMTPWFVNGEKPARPGVYEVSVYEPEHSEFDPAYSYFDGEIWCEYLWFLDCNQTPDDAYEGRGQMIGAGTQTMAWRGLTNEARDAKA